MKTKSRVRCALPVGRWASYAAAGAATFAAANDAEAQIYYSGILNTPVNSAVTLHTLVSNGHQGGGSLMHFTHQFFTASGGIAQVHLNNGANARVAGFYASSNATESKVGYPSKQAAGVAINGGLNFISRGTAMLGLTYINSPGGHKNSCRAASFRNQGDNQFLAFEFNKGAGDQYGWVRLNMTTGGPKNSYTVDDYAYGAVGQAITVGESTPPLPTWTGNATDHWDNTGNWSTGVVPGATSGTTNTDTAYFSQAFTNEPDIFDTTRNLMNIVFNMPNSQTTVIGAFGQGNPSLLLTEGGSIQIASTAHIGGTLNVPLILEGSPNVMNNSYTFSNLTNLPGQVVFVSNSTISAAASNSLTTLNLAGISTANNELDGVLSDGAGGAKLALNVQGGNWLLVAAYPTPNSYSGGTTIASGATLRISSNPTTPSVMTQSMNIANSGALIYSGSIGQNVGTITGTGSTTVQAGASLTAYQIRQNSLTIGSGALVTLSPSGSGSTTNPAGPNNINFSSSVNSLSIAGTMNAWTGTLDIGNNGLVINYGNLANDPYSTINNMIESGYNGGVWGGTGINSTLAQAGVTLHISTPLNIGLLDFTPGTGNYSNTTFIVFEGQTVTTNAILVRLTYMDDLVLAGDMSSNNATSDALLFAANYGTGTTWGVGDLTHNGGPIDSSDALLFAANYVVGLPSLDGTSGNDVALGSGAAAVPEPASLGLLAFGAAGVLAIRLRRSRKKRLSADALDTAELFTSDWEGPAVSPLIAHRRSR